MKKIEVPYFKPTLWSERKWTTAVRIIDAIARRNATSNPTVDPCLSNAELSMLVGIPRNKVMIYIRELCELRIISRKMRFGANGDCLIAAMWLLDPRKQIDEISVRRSRRLAALEPEIRQALKEDKESLRSVARRYGVSADTVQEIRRRIAPFDSGSAVQRRCPSCGAMITSPACLACSLG